MNLNIVLDCLKFLSEHFYALDYILLNNNILNSILITIKIVLYWDLNQLNGNIIS